MASSTESPSTAQLVREILLANTGKDMLDFLDRPFEELPRRHRPRARGNRTPVRALYPPGHSGAHHRPL